MKNFQMVDFAVNDQRSAAAMLRGKGDGRENVWLGFEGKHEALMDQAELQAAFTNAARYGRVGRESAINKIKRMLLVALSVLVVIS